MWLDGGSYREINEETGESIGSISNKINKARRSYPDLNELRQLNLFLKENGLKIKKALIGLKFVSKFKKLGIEEEKVAEVINQITKYGKEISKILDEAKELYTFKEKLAWNIRRYLKAINEKWTS